MKRLTFELGLTFLFGNFPLPWRTTLGRKQAVAMRPQARGGYSCEFLVGVCRPVLQILTRFQTKKLNFPHPFSDKNSKIHTRFQTWPLGKNYVILTLIRAQIKKMFKSIFEFAYFSFFLIHLELKR